jgi:hypothetical protein
MFKKITAFVITVLFLQTGFAQSEKPDFKKIEKAVNDKGSPFFYAALMKRYSDNDTTLTKEEYRHLYYGYCFQKTYSPYGRPSVNDELKKAITAGETNKIIELEKKALAEYPFNLRDLYMLSKTLIEKGETALGNVYDKKMIDVASAIMSTGNGASDSTSIYVISVDHEYNLISLLGFKFGGSQSLIYGKDGPTDKMKLEKNDDGLEYLYFNVDRLFASMKKMFDKKN